MFENPRIERNAVRREIVTKAGRSRAPASTAARKPPMTWAGLRGSPPRRRPPCSQTRSLERQPESPSPVVARALLCRNSLFLKPAANRAQKHRFESRRGFEPPCQARLQACGGLLARCYHSTPIHGDHGHDDLPLRLVISTLGSSWVSPEGLSSRELVVRIGCVWVASHARLCHVLQDWRLEVFDTWHPR